MDQRDGTPATMTVEDAGRLLGISRRAAYRAAAAGHIPVIRLGRRIRIPTARLHHMLGIQPTTPQIERDQDGTTTHDVQAQSQGSLDRSRAGDRPLAADDR